MIVVIARNHIENYLCTKQPLQDAIVIHIFDEFFPRLYRFHSLPKSNQLFEAQA